MTGAPLVDIIVLNYNGKRFLTDCFNSLRESTYQNFKVHLLDNSSTDDDVAWTREHFPWVNIIQNPLNNGYCAAYNLGFSKTDGKYAVCLNNDVKVFPGWLEPMVELAESDPNIGAIQPKILAMNQPDTFEYAGASGGLMDKYGFPFMRGRLFDTLEKDLGQYDDVTSIFWASGASMFVRKSVLEQSGNLDEIIVHHMDEIDLCWRMQLHGYSIKVQPRSVILHVGGATIKSRSFKKTYWNHRNSIYMMLKNYGIGNMISRTTVHCMLDWVAFFQSLLTGQFQVARGIAAAHLWILVNLGMVAAERRKVQATRKVTDDVVDRNVYQGSVVWAYFARGIKSVQHLKP